MSLKTIKTIIALVAVLFIGLAGFLAGQRMNQTLSLQSGPECPQCPECEKLSHGLFSAGAAPVYTDPNNPRPSPPVSIEDLPAKAKEYGVEPADIIHIKAQNGAFEPSQFKAKPNQKVVLVFTSADNQIHILKFKEEQLQDISVGVYGGETKIITFKAPDKIGNYTYFCDFPNHIQLGEQGVMVVE